MSHVWFCVDWHMSLLLLSLLEAALLGILPLLLNKLLNQIYSFCLISMRISSIWWIVAMKMLFSNHAGWCHFLTRAFATIRLPSWITYASGTNSARVRLYWPCNVRVWSTRHMLNSRDPLYQAFSLGVSHLTQRYQFLLLTTREPRLRESQAQQWALLWRNNVDLAPSRSLKPCFTELCLNVCERVYKNSENALN